MAGITTDISLYSEGDIVLQYPIEASTTFLFVILLAAILEFCIDYAAGVENKYFRVMFDAINQEVMIVGVLVLMLNFAQSITAWPTRWVSFFQWAMMCLFFMVLFFVGIVTFVLVFITSMKRSWLHFEQNEMDADPETHSTRQRQYQKALLKFQAALLASGYDPTLKGMVFSEYLGKVVRRNVVAMTDLSWVSWVCLATLVILNTLRAEATRRLSSLNDENIEDALNLSQRVAHYLSFVFFIGYIMLLVFVILYYRMHSSLNEFLDAKPKRSGEDIGGADMAAPEGGGAAGVQMLNTKDMLEDPRAKLFRRSREATMEVVQILVLCFEWYTSFFFLSFSNEAITNLGVGGAVGVFITALIPVIVMCALLPWFLTMISLLSCLGTSLDEGTVQHLIIAAGVPEDEWPLPMRAAQLAKRGEDDEEDDASGGDDHSSHLAGSDRATTMTRRTHRDEEREEQLRREALAGGGGDRGGGNSQQRSNRRPLPRNGLDRML